MKKSRNLFSLSDKGSKFMLKKSALGEDFYNPVLNRTLGICVPIFMVMIVLKILNADIAPLTRDITQYAKLPFYTGIISNLGILLWGATAAICFFSAVVIQKIGISRNLFYFFLASGALTTWLLLDDSLTFHEVVLPILLRLPQKLIYAGYLGMVGIYLWKFRHQIMRTNKLNLRLAIVFFGFSLLIDSILGKNEFIFEDGFKLLGIINWHLYFTYACFQVITAPAPI